MTLINRSVEPAPTPEQGAAGVHIRLRTGDELTVLEFNERGGRVEGQTRLLPGTRIELHVSIAESRSTVRTRIVRSHVSRITSDGVWYQSVLAFES